MNITDEFLENINQISIKPIPQKVLEKAKKSLLDYLCVTLAGTRFQAEKLEKYLEFAEPEAGKYKPIGMSNNVSLKEAAFLNGLNGHALDYDDGTNTGIIHLGSPLFSVLLPLAQKYNFDLNKVLKAAIIGYEASFTMAISIQPKHKEMGYHATGTCGVLGIAIAASYLLDFTNEERKETFAAACVSATGMLNVLDDGAELKPYNVAKSALMGLLSTQMAKAGFKGHPNSLAGNRGFLKMMTGESDIVLKKPLIGGTYAIEKTYTKPYAACRYCHPAIESAIAMREKHNIKADDVKNVCVKTYYWAVNNHDHIIIPSVASAKMSIPYGIAVALLYGNAGLNEYSENLIRNSTVLSLVSKVCVFSDDELTAQFPEITTAIVEITKVSGEIVRECVTHPKGEPENPMTNNEFKERFLQLTQYGGKSKENALQIYDNIMKKNDTVNNLSKFL